jgi:3-deoxy-manno-octulosonate cytidylyltransferase (CMP-KDO synthetase)
MIQRVYERIVDSPQIDNIYVATDDKRIQEVVKNFGGNVIMTSSLHESGSDRVYEAANHLGMDIEDLIINVQGDQPLVDARCLSDLIKPFSGKKHPEMATLALPLRSSDKLDNPRDVKVVFDLEGYALYFSRSVIPFHRKSTKDITIYKHLGLYAYKKKFLGIFNKLAVGKLENIEKLEQLRSIEHGYGIYVAITKYDSPEVDTLSDVKQIENKIKGV